MENNIDFPRLWECSDCSDAWFAYSFDGFSDAADTKRDFADIIFETKVYLIIYFDANIFSEDDFINDRVKTFFSWNGKIKSAVWNIKTRVWNINSADWNINSEDCFFNTLVWNILSADDFINSADGNINSADCFSNTLDWNILSGDSFFLHLVGKIVSAVAFSLPLVWNYTSGDDYFKLEDDYFRQ